MDVLHREVNVATGDPDRSRRKSALEKILAVAKGNELSSADANNLSKALLRVLEDKTEKCRELSVEVLHALQPRCSLEALDWLLPALVTRIGAAPVAEESEEIRLRLLQLAVQIMDAHKHDIGPRGHLDYFKNILEVCLRDAFPDVKRLACKGCIALCQAEPKKIRSMTMPLAKAVKNWCLPHKHSVVRADAVEAFACLVNHGSAEMLADSREEQDNRTTVQALYVLSNDHSDAVRIAVVHALETFLVTLTERNEQTRRLMPILLALISDSHDDVRLKANSVMLELGKLHALDNEDNRIDLAQRRVSLKDIDWYSDDAYPDMALSTAPLFGVPDLQRRPILGARYAVAEVVGQYLDKVLADVTAMDWSIPFSNVNKRVVALRVVFMTIYYCESNIVQHVQSILNSLYKALRDPEKGIQHDAASCVELLGKFLRPEHYLPLIISAAPPGAVESESDAEVMRLKHKTITSVSIGAPTSTALPTLLSTAASVTKVAVLVSFRLLLRGSASSITASQASDIVKALTNPDLIDVDAPALLVALLDAIETCGDILARRQFISTPSQPMPQEVIDNPKQRTLDSMLMYTSLCIQACDDPAVVQKARDVIGKLSQLVVGSPKGLYSIHAGRLLRRYVDTMPPQALRDLLENTGDGPGQHGEVLTQLFCSRLSNVNYTLKVSSELMFFTLLRNVLASCEKGTTSIFDSTQVEQLLRQIVLVHGKYAPGAAAHLFRKLAVSCLSSIVSARVRSLLREALHADAAALTEKIAAMWLHAADSDDGEMRLACVLMAGKVAALPLTAGSAADFWNHLLQLLDDTSDALRFETARCIQYIVTTNDEVSRALVAEVHSQLATSVKKLLIHLDDHIETMGIKEVITQVLQRFTGLDEKLVKDLVSAVRTKHHTPKYCDAILEFGLKS